MYGHGQGTVIVGYEIHGAEVALRGAHVCTVLCSVLFLVVPRVMEMQ